jgi:hypothetical protein
MKLRTILAATALAAVAAPAAAPAQTPPDPITGGTQIGGSVPSFLELILNQPTSGFTTFPKAKTYTASFDVAITTTDPTAVLSLADGEVATGSKLGHLASGPKRLPLPLEARVGKSAFQRLDTAVDPLLTKWTQASTRAKTTVNLRQQVTGKASGSYRKVLLVTLSTETP